MKGKIEPYIDFKGNAREALNFYAEVFEAETPQLFLFTDMPAADQTEAQKYQPSINPEWVMNGSVRIGDTFLMASDTSDEMMAGGKGFIPGNNMTLAYSSEDGDEVQRVWDRFVQAGADVIMPLSETFWARQYGFLVDPFGIQWMIQEWARIP